MISYVVRPKKYSFVTVYSNMVLCQCFGISTYAFFYLYRALLYVQLISTLLLLFVVLRKYLKHLYVYLSFFFHSILNKFLETDSVLSEDDDLSIASEENSETESIHVSRPHRHSAEMKHYEQSNLLKSSPTVHKSHANEKDRHGYHAASKSKFGLFE